MQTLKPFLSRMLTYLIMMLLPLALGAQNELSELEKQQIENFRNPNVNYIPYQGKTLKDFETRGDVFNNEVEMKSIAEHPILSKKKKNNGSKVTQNVGTDDLEEIGTITTPTWGVATLMEDNTAITFTQDFTVSFTYGSSKQKYYNSTTITLLDENFDSIKSITIKTPDTTQSIRVLGIFSKKMFNSDDKIELMVKVHGFASEYWGQGPISCRDTILVVNEDGEILRRYGNVSSANIHKIGSTNRLMIAMNNYSGVTDTIVMHIYDAKKADTTSPLFTFKMQDKVFNYSLGPVFANEKIGDKNYYITSFYEKPFDSAQNSSNPIISKNNKFIIRMYDATKFTIAKEIKLDLFGQDKHEWSMASMNDFGDIMFTDKLFNQDSLIEIIYGVARYYVDCDCNRTDIYLVNEKGEILKEIIKRTGGTYKLQNLAGQSDEYAVFMGGEGKIEAIQMFEMPGMKANFSFPASHKGEMLSLSFDRVLDGKGGKEYVFGLGGGESANGTVYAGIAYYDVAGNMTKRHRIDVGNKVALVSFIINPSVLNPYMINTDDKREYLFFGKEYTTGSNIESYFGIASETGETLYKWYSHPKYAKFAGAGIIQNKIQNRVKSLYVYFSDLYTPDLQTTVFYKLPFAVDPMKGDGSEGNPFVITTPAELDGIRNNDSAYYILGNDIDMSNFTGYQGMGFLPLFDEVNKGFKGSFDGKGYAIKNLYIACDKNSSNGLFASLVDSNTVVRNLFIKNAFFKVSKGSTLGIIAANLASGARIENCHVEANLDLPEYSSQLVGGIVGSATMQSKIRQCSYTGNINAPLVTNLGGIVGRATTGTSILACYSSGNITGKSAIGGIAGLLMSDGLVTSCYSDMQITGGANLGALVGYQRGGSIHKNYAKGNVSSLKSFDKWADAASSIVANVASAMGAPISVKYNVGLSEIISAEVDSSAARIVGDGINLPGSTFDSNYALSTMKIGAPGAEVVLPANDPNSTMDKKNGASKTLAEMNQTFYENIGWSFGTNIESPWKMVGNYPRLWFEFLVRGVEISAKNLILNINEKATLTATVLPTSAENKEVLWESSDPSVVSVDQQGNLTAKKRGEATITVTTDAGDFEKTCIVKVVQPITSVKLDKEEITIASKQRTVLVATILPADADNKILKWTCSDPKIAIVFDGTVVGGEIGKAIIIVSSEDGKYSDTCKLNVVVAVEKIILDQTELDLQVGATVKLKASVRPSDASNKKVIWESADTTIASVDNTGLVTGRLKGIVIITAKSAENETIKAECTVNVNGVGVEGMDDFIFKAYMNKNILHIESDKEIEQILICDMLGRTIYNKEQNANNLAISMQNDPNGIYIVKVSFKNGLTKNLKIKK